MQSIETIPGRLYSVHTLVGCTVSDGQGWSKAIVAPDGFFTAHGLRVNVSDDAATVREARGMGKEGLSANEEVTETVTVVPLGTSEDNFNSYGFVCIAALSGTITQLDIECRANRTAEPVDTPVYVKVWRGTEELLARSTNAQTHTVAATLSYTFAPFEVAAGDELRVTFHTADGMDSDAWQMGLMCCLRAVALTEGESGGMLNSAGGYSSASFTAKYAWYLQVDKFAPMTHVGDSSHLNEVQRELLDWLAANKDGLAGLVAAAVSDEESLTETE